MDLNQSVRSAAWQANWAPEISTGTATSSIVQRAPSRWQKPIQDKTYPSLWRVRRLDGSISDMVNRTRAKDAAIAIHLADQRAQLSHVEPPPMRQSS